MKRLLSSVFLMASLLASACWFTEANFNTTYIAGVNNYFSHYEEAESLAESEYNNGQVVAMPITVWVKVSPRIADQPGEPAGAKDITRAVLQYKVLPDGEWITAKDYDIPDWSLDFDHPVALFGRNCISLNLPSGTQILIRVYFTDGTYETGDLEADIISNVPDVATLNVGGTYEGGWCAPHVMRVVIGKWRPAR
jgi:hypothetical protein